MSPSDSAPTLQSIVCLSRRGRAGRAQWREDPTKPESGKVGVLLFFQCRLIRGLGVEGFAIVAGGISGSAVEEPYVRIDLCIGLVHATGEVIRGDVVDGGGENRPDGVLGPVAGIECVREVADDPAERIRARVEAGACVVMRRCPNSSSRVHAPEGGMWMCGPQRQ